MARDLRRYARQTHVQLAAGFLLLLFVVGDGLIYFFYGREAALLGLLCILSGLVPLVLVWLVLISMEWLVKRSNGDNES
jgi:uncharacterized SAM-binding protein YcdF (DUF218 family)